ncbi:MAG: universal stress protein [Pseudomonadota bacterium]|jgi:nucleotide-binding universal stress UspA family protein
MSLNILLAVDGSEHSLRAVRGLIEYARELREAPRIQLLFVHPPVPIAFATQHVSQEVLDRYYRDEGEAALRQAAAALGEARLPFVSHIHVGPPAETIVKLAGDFNCRLICLGSHGRGALANAMVGSVAAKVLHLARLPVLLFK